MTADTKRLASHRHAHHCAAGDDEPAGTRSRAPGGTRDDGVGAVLRVLVVEDLPRVQQLLRELIHEPGRLEVAGLAETEQDAIAQFELLAPHAVVVDLNLKSGTGLGVIAGLRRKSGIPQPLLIVLTNHALPVLEAACLKAGADYFLDKSRDFHKVRTLLEHAWSRNSELPDLSSGLAAGVKPPGGPTMH